MQHAICAPGFAGPNVDDIHHRAAGAILDEEEGLALRVAQGAFFGFGVQQTGQVFHFAGFQPAHTGRQNSLGIE